GGGGGRARGPARDGVEVSWVVDGAEARVLVRGPHRELVAVRLAHQNGARRPQASPGRPVIGRDVRLEAPRSGGGDDPAGRQHVLQRAPDARARPPPLAPPPTA